MFLIDTAAGRIVSDDEIKGQLAAEHPYGEWLHAGLLDTHDACPTAPASRPTTSRWCAGRSPSATPRRTCGSCSRRWRPPVRSRSGRWAPTPRPRFCRSARKLFYDYFVELFAQVTNPPLDAIREEIVTSMARVMGPEQNLLEPTAASCRQILLRWPVLDNDELNKIVHINDDGEHPGLKTAVLRALYDVERGGEGLADAIEELRHRASDAIAKGARTLVISDRDSDHTRAPIPSLLAVSAVHHHLVRTKQRTMVALVVESGDAREVHHIALLIGFGAAAVNPYLAFESIEDLIREGELTGIETGYGGAQLPQGARQGRDEGDEQDGHLHRRLLHGRTGVRGDRPRQGRRRRVPDRHVQPARRRRSRRARRGGQAASPPGLPGEPDRAGAPPARGRRRVRSSAAKASCTCSPRKRCSCFSIRPAPAATTSSRSTPTRSNRLSREGGTLRGLFDFKKGLRPPVPLRRGGVGRVDLSPVQHRRHELRLDLRRGPRDHGDRDEQARRPLQLAVRAARTPTGSTTRAGAAPSSRSRRGGSASPATIWSTRPISRSRWPRVPNPVRAANFPASRSIRTSPRPGIPRRVSA